MMERSISKTKLKDVLAIPKNSRVLVVNDTEENAEEMVYMLYELGIGHLQLIPYAPSQPDTYADINYAITPDEMPFVPAHIQNVINTGYRMLSFDAISKIAEWLALEPQETAKKMESRMRQIDQKRRDYYQYYSGNEWGNPRNYHLSLNSGKLGIEKCVDMILESLKLYEQ